MILHRFCGIHISLHCIKVGGKQLIVGICYAFFFKTVCDSNEQVKTLKRPVQVKKNELKMGRGCLVMYRPKAQNDMSQQKINFCPIKAQKLTLHGPALTPLEFTPPLHTLKLLYLIHNYH